MSDKIRDPELRVAMKREDYELLVRAAKMEDRTLSSFCRWHLVRAARKRATFGSPTTIPRQPTEFKDNGR